MSHSAKSTTKSTAAQRDATATRPIRTRGKALPPDADPAVGPVPDGRGTVPPVANAANSVASDNHAANDNAIGISADAGAAPTAYEIGYGKPPIEHQFKKGQSGNPKGRAKGSRNTRTIFEAESQKKVTVTENGKTRNLTKRELVVKNVVNKAANGEEKALVTFLKLDERFSATRGSPDSAKTDVPETMAELSAADRIILDRYRSLIASGSAGDEPDPNAGNDNTAKS